MAMDIQEGMLAEVKKRAEKEGHLNISYLQGGIGEGKLIIVYSWEKSKSKFLSFTIQGL